MARTVTRKHKCQSSLVRCALRGQHPRYVVAVSADRRQWLVIAPLNGLAVRYLPRVPRPFHPAFMLSEAVQEVHKSTRKALRAVTDGEVRP